ncbi:MAG: lysophospholipid acyltransferase family protein [Proteobacteria bacterium]|nr:lysophospholipid acyltransferase family protein [Pseudomonadota bacterium]
MQKLSTDFYIGIAKLLVKLPLLMVLKLGAFLGFLTGLIPNKRKKIAARNIELCFPELSAKQQKTLLKQNLISTGVGFAEMLVAYWGKTDKFIDRFEFEGLELVEQALQKNKGCILLSCHLHSMELATRAINTQLKQPAFILGRQHNNKIFEAHIDKARKEHCEKTIDKKDLFTVLKTFRKNRCIYYIPDQNFSYHCEYIDFFKLPAATVLAPVKIARSSQASVVPWFCFRENNQWKVQFLEPLDYFYGDDVHSSLTQMNQLFESQIKKHPEQYLWVHRRFKNHPKGKNYLYTDI